MKHEVGESDPDTPPQTNINTHTCSHMCVLAHTHTIHTVYTDSKQTTIPNKTTLYQIFPSYISLTKPNEFVKVCTENCSTLKITL